jgi:predicted peroxiredoxin
MNRLSMIGLLVAGLILTSAWSGPALGWAQEPQKAQNVVIHLKHYTDNLHAVSMALKLGKGIQQKGGQVTLMLDLEGVRLVDSRQPQDLRWGTEIPMSTHYEAFIKSGGRAVVCPHCAHAAGLTEKDLRAGARIATEEELAQLILGADKILDY